MSGLSAPFALRREHADDRGTARSATVRGVRSTCSPAAGRRCGISHKQRVALASGIETQSVSHCISANVGRACALHTISRRDDGHHEDHSATGVRARLHGLDGHRDGAAHRGRDDAVLLRVSPRGRSFIRRLLPDNRQRRLLESALRSHRVPCVSRIAPTLDGSWPPPPRICQPV